MKLNSFKCFDAFRKSCFADCETNEQYSGVWDVWSSNILGKKVIKKVKYFHLISICMFDFVMF